MVRPRPGHGRIQDGFISVELGVVSRAHEARFGLMGKTERTEWRAAAPAGHEGGHSVTTTRGFAIGIIGLLLSGCASEGARPWGPAQRLGAGSLNVVATAVAAEQQQSPAHDVGPVRKTLGGKVLSALALERATGRKPDPSRLKELD